jgi:integrase
MSRAAVEARIQDRTPRARLLPRRRPYWRQLSEGAFLGYYRGTLKGSWVAKFHDAATGAYVTGTLGEADDDLDADGRTILTYKQAFDAALRWIELKTSGDDLPPAIASDPDMTVAQAVQAYIALRDARSSQRAGRDIKSDASSSLTRYVLEDKRLPIVRLAALVEADLRGWQLRCTRKKPSSLQRVVNDFKAALNYAFEMHRRVLPADLPIVIKFGLKLDAPELLSAVARDNQILSDDEVRAIVSASIALDEDFGRLVVLLAATGARFSQIARMTVGDVQLGQSRLMLPQSFKGRKRTLSYIRVPVGADTIAAIEPATRGPARPRRCSSIGGTSRSRRCSGSGWIAAPGPRPRRCCGRSTRRWRMPGSAARSFPMRRGTRRSCGACAPGCRSGSWRHFTTPRSR